MRAKLMLVDDGENIHKLIRRIVERVDYGFSGAFSRDEGLLIIERIRPACSFLT